MYSEDFIESDLERLTRFYQSEGFLYVNVRLDSLAVNDEKRRVNIYISIEENTPVKVGDISIAISDPPERPRPEVLLRRIRRRSDLKKSVRFTDQALYDDVARINRIFNNLGYVYVKTDFDLNIRQTDTTDIAYQINPAIITQFGETTITGNRYLKDKYIRRQIAYKEGNTFKSNLLDKTRKNLYDLQLFRVVSVSPQTDRATLRNPIPIQLTIEEMPRWMSRFGLGWGTEDKFRGFVDVTYRGLFNGTSRLNLYAKHSALIPYSISLSWIQPQFFIKGVSVSVNPYLQRIKEPGYETQTFGVKLPVNYIISNRMTASLAYYFEKVTQHTESGVTHIDLPNPEDEKFLYSKSGLVGGFTYTSANPVYAPIRGWAVTVGAKLNGYIFGGDFDYTRLSLDVRKYQKLGDFTVGVRGMIGAIHSSDTSGFIPVEDRFYSGGSNSNRGWGRSMLGPLRENGTPIGGKSIIEMNAEVSHPLFWELQIAAFLDVSNIWQGSYDFQFNNLAYAAGGGLRINTPIGPVRLDLGVPLGNEKKSVQFFISIGQAF